MRSKIPLDLYVRANIRTVMRYDLLKDYSVTN